MSSTQNSQDLPTDNRPTVPANSRSTPSGTVSRAAVNEKLLGGCSDQVLRSVPQSTHKLNDHDCHASHCSSIRRSLDLGFGIVTWYHNTWNLNSAQICDRFKTLRCFKPIISYREYDTCSARFHLTANSS